jgi:Fe-S cluster assembly protein SufD
MSLVLTSALPTNRDENWRYANLRPLTKARPEPVGPASPPALNVTLPAPLPGHERWVFVDGHFDASRSTAGTGSPAALTSARDGGAAFQSMLDGAIAAEGADFALARVNAQRGNDVLHIRLADGAPRAAIELLFIASSSAAAGSSYPRVQVQAGRDTSLSLVERHASAGDIDALVNAAVDLALAPGARVDHIRVQSAGAAASVFDTLTAHVAQNARYHLRTMTLGGISSRSTMFIKLAGRSARCELSAAAVANGTQTHDLFVEIDHAAPETTTRELFRGIANERGKLAFNGKMIVRENAHGADSDQSLKSLLTGSGAEAAARPQLEIYTDKVRAKHGATTGKLDEQMLFYLLSRGLDRTTAQALLQWAFVEDAVSLVEPGELRREIEGLVATRLRAVSSLDGLLGDLL